MPGGSEQRGGRPQPGPEPGPQAPRNGVDASAGNGHPRVDLSPLSALSRPRPDVILTLGPLRRTVSHPGMTETGTKIANKAVLNASIEAATSDITAVRETGRRIGEPQPGVVEHVTHSESPIILYKWQSEARAKGTGTDPDRSLRLTVAEDTAVMRAAAHLNGDVPDEADRRTVLSQVGMAARLSAAEMIDAQELQARRRKLGPSTEQAASPAPDSGTDKGTVVTEPAVAAATTAEPGTSTDQESKLGSAPPPAVEPADPAAAKYRETMRVEGIQPGRYKAKIVVAEK